MRFLFLVIALVFNLLFCNLIYDYEESDYRILIFVTLLVLTQSLYILKMLKLLKTMLIYSNSWLIFFFLVNMNIYENLEIFIFSIFRWFMLIFRFKIFGLELNPIEFIEIRTTIIVMRKFL